MEINKLEKSVERLSEAINEFPFYTILLDQFIPTEEKIQATRRSLMHLNARLLMLTANYKQYTTDGRQKEKKAEFNDLQKAINDTLINIKTIELCLHSATIFSILDDKEGDVEEQKKLLTYMSKLFTLNDNIMSIQTSIEEASQVQLDLKLECQKALFNYKDFLNKEKEIRDQKLQEMHPDIVHNKTKMEKNLRKINITKKLIRNFIAVSGYMLAKEPKLLEMLEKHRELINVETILTMSQNNENTSK